LTSKTVSTENLIDNDPIRRVLGKLLMREYNLNGKTAVITGASKGLGKAMALALGSAGANIALVSRDIEQLNEAKRAVESAGGRAEVFPTDVSEEEQVRKLERDVVAAFNGVHILINNAGINLRKQLVEFTLEEWRRVLDTNLTSVFLMCRSFIPHLRGRGYGRIINLTSTMSHVSIPGRSAYSASKTALLGLTRALALELASEGITVNGISPGPFATEMNTSLIQNPEINQQLISKIPVGRWGRVEEIGQLALYLCSEAAGFITGTDILVDGGWTAQ
jgi:NAD(P)-dependent dehydrogenase (short-subunit alcohol dehydrogenase family)